jgi:hypothetical protein
MSVSARQHWCSVFTHHEEDTHAQIAADLIASDTIDRPFLVERLES